MKVGKEIFPELRRDIGVHLQIPGAFTLTLIVKHIQERFKRYKFFFPVCSCSLHPLGLCNSLGYFHSALEENTK